MEHFVSISILLTNLLIAPLNNPNTAELILNAQTRYVLQRLISPQIQGAYDSKMQYKALLDPCSLTKI